MSEFGSGITVCLAKFSEHLWGGSAYDESLIRDFDRWCKMSDTAKENKKAEARIYPRGDAAHFLNRISIYADGTFSDIYDSEEKMLSHLIEMWANAASDHFYDLDEKAPEPLKELASLTLKMGHGFTGTIWTMEDMYKVRELWKESALEVDKMLGVAPDWGEY